MSNAVATVTAIAKPKIEELGLELWDAEFKKEGADYFLRLYINRKDGGVSIEDCEAVDAYVSPLLDEADPIEQSYYFEVSSAGLVRTLKYDWHYDRYIGHEVTFFTFKSDDGMPKKFNAVLDGYDENRIRYIYNGEARYAEKSNISKIIIDLV